MQREIYANRAAEAAGVTAQAVKMEVEKAWKQRRNAERKKQEAIDLAPAKQLQPQIRGLRYDDVKSAAAEEGLLRMLLREPELIPTVSLSQDDFSVPLFANVYAALTERFSQGAAVTLAALEGSFTPEEMAHLSRITSKDDVPLTEQALSDYVRTIRERAAGRQPADGQSLMRMAERMRQTKGYGG